MIIDLILDRRDIESERQKTGTCEVTPDYIGGMYEPFWDAFEAKGTKSEKIKLKRKYKGLYVYRYTPESFYSMVAGYGEIGFDITAAMDYGTEADVRKALCNYIDKQEYNPKIKDYINSVKWLTPAPKIPLEAKDVL